MSEENTTTMDQEIDPLIASGELEMEDGDTGDLPELVVEDAPEGRTKTKVKAKPESEDELDAEGAGYWKEKYQQAKQYESLSKYQGIIGALESNPDLVDVLERAMAGELDAARYSEFTEDEDSAPTEGQRRPTAADLKKAEEEGARKALAQQELNAALRTLAEWGIPDHAVDKFMNWANDPQGMTVLDLFNVFQTVEERSGRPVKGKGQSGKTRKQGGTSVAALPGNSDRPSADKYVPAEDAGTYHYRSDPNNI